MMAGVVGVAAVSWLLGCSFSDMSLNSIVCSMLVSSVSPAHPMLGKHQILNVLNTFLFEIIIVVFISCFVLWLWGIAWRVFSNGRMENEDNLHSSSLWTGFKHSASFSKVTSAILWAPHFTHFLHMYLFVWVGWNAKNIKLAVREPKLEHYTFLTGWMALGRLDNFLELQIHHLWNEHWNLSHLIYHRVAIKN